jgi:hypothetical protein
MLNQRHFFSLFVKSTRQHIHTSRIKYGKSAKPQDSQAVSTNHLHICVLSILVYEFYVFPSMLKLELFPLTNHWAQL